MFYCDNCQLFSALAIVKIYCQRLQAIDTANEIGELNRQIYKLHPLKGDREGYWSITVRANWRITFQFINGDAYILNYEDYH
nr:type II toxin-antitoxin system RelE/ParE family toxin [Photorhabdus australis]